VAAALLAACGAAAPAARQATPSGQVATATATPAIPSSAAPGPIASPGYSVTPVPSAPKPIPFSCSSSIPTGANLALVTLTGSADLVVRDITDIARPVTRCSFRTCLQYCESFGPNAMRFLDRSHVSYIVNDGNGGYAIYIADLETRTSILVIWLKPEGSISAYAWRPGTSAVLYVKPSDTGMVLHESIAGRDRVVATMPPLPAVGCEQQCVGQDTWDFSLLYSPDGSLLSLTDSIVRPVFRVWTGDGELVDQNDTQTRSMSVWSGNSLYFNGGGGVVVWRNRTITPFLPGTVWIRPNASPDGTQIVFGARDSSGWIHSVIAETSTGKTFELKKGRSEPVYLSSRYVWYQGERACVTADHCVAFPTVPSGTTYIYDLLNQTEAASAIAAVADVWPHQGAVS